PESTTRVALEKGCVGPLHAVAKTEWRPCALPDPARRLQFCAPLSASQHFRQWGSPNEARISVIGFDFFVLFLVRFRTTGGGRR
ncbi:MAG: hypothetical protein AAF762_02290, partial [Pseudomonadota bacterium]